MQTYAYGYPRLGRKREYKHSIEGYWGDDVSGGELWQDIHRLQEDMLSAYKRFVDGFPKGEITLYDNMLDTAITVGLYSAESLDEYYSLCRGEHALELTKWFNTNYHYLVPDFSTVDEPIFKLNPSRYGKIPQTQGEGIPYLIGPFTFLKLAKGVRKEKFSEHLRSLGDIYCEIIRDLGEVHIDEPAFVTDVSPWEIEAIKEVYGLMGECGDINLFTYYDSVDFLRDLYMLPVKSIGLDFVNGRENYGNIKKYGFPEDKILVAGLVNGRNVWRTNIKDAVKVLRDLSRSAENIMVSNAAPLYHLPETTEDENLDPKLLNKLAFAWERLKEIQLISRLYVGQEVDEWWSPPDFTVNKEVRERVRNLREEDFRRSVPCPLRARIQKEILNLPLFPAATIGSFPQTPDVRKMRADYTAGRISEEEYRDFIRDKISEVIRIQEELGLDVLVHGEFERSDMVEFFAEQLEGIASTKKGWIISYGTRCYRPPIIYGDISRPEPMTLREIALAQSMTDKPVKGMVTGPVTIIAWSFIREDIPVHEVAYQISLCLQDEIRDYEGAGIRIVQVDEPAFREKAPLKKRDWSRYFNWAIKSFRLSTISKPETQIHTHMCYSEFAEIIDRIIEMDFDVISLEAARSKGDILGSFRDVDFNRQIGLGVWDIHSPVVPSVGDMRRIVDEALEVIPRENLWINPDCGLKTRGWEETVASLRNIVSLARQLRGER